MINKWLLWGGGGAVALVAGVLLFRGNSAPADSGGDSGLGAYYPATVYGSGYSGGGSTTSDGSGASTDNSIAQLIAGNLAVAQQQSSTTKYVSDNDRAIALATLENQKTVAANDNAAKLALAQNNTRGEIQKTLAAQVGQLANKYGGKGLTGWIGFDGDTINVDIGAMGTTQTPTKPTKPIRDPIY